MSPAPLETALALSVALIRARATATMELATSTVDTGIGDRSVKVDGARGVELETRTQSVGVIIPPPDVRVIVDKTAQFVGKNGPEFEQRILA